MLKESRTNVGTSSEPEHIVIANQFANEMICRFNPLELNEICQQIRKIFIENREMEIESTKNKLSYLEQSLEEI